MWTGLMAIVLAQSAGPVCELHLWGSGRPNFVLPARVLRNVDPASIDRSNPNATVNTLNTVNRVVALPDAELAALMPAGAQVTVVRHETMIDTDATPLDKIAGRLAASDAPCYADLILSGSYAIFPSTRLRDAAWAGRGLAGEAVIAALAGDDRLVLEFRLRDFTGMAGGREVKRKNDSPLPPVPIQSAEMKAAIEASAVVNLRSFVAYVRQKRGG